MRFLVQRKSGFDSRGHRLRKSMCVEGMVCNHNEQTYVSIISIIYIVNSSTKNS